MFNRGKGDSDRREMMREQSQRNQEQAMQSAAISQALQQQPLNDAGQIREEYLSSLVDSGLNKSSAQLLSDMLTRDFVLSNITEAEGEEMKWLSRLLLEKIEAMHPPEGSVMQGEYRAFLSDDPTDTLRPLSQKQKLLLKMAIKHVFFRVARSRGGWQQAELGRVYAVAESRSEKEEDSGGWFFK